MTNSKPIYRSTYRAQARPAQEAAAVAHFEQAGAAIRTGLQPGDLMTISVFQWGAHFIAYWESVQREIGPDALFGDMHALLADWPGATTARSCAPMMDIFHSQAPDSVDHWRRKQPVQRRWGALARLQPDMVSSYIYYHYQMQEERPGRLDKYGIISLHEDWIFYYRERPSVVEAPPRAGKLSTANTPDNWQETMFPHFHRWEDAPPKQEIWREITLVFSASAG